MTSQPDEPVLLLHVHERRLQARAHPGRQRGEHARRRGEGVEAAEHAHVAGLAEA